MPVGLGGELSEVLLERYGAALVSARLGGSSQGSRRQAASQRDRAMSEPSIQQALMQIIPSQSNSTHQTTLRPGQVLLLEVFPASTQLMAQDFSLITTVPGSRPPRVGTFMDRARVYIAALVLIAMVTLSATVVSLLTAGLLASFILLSIKTIPLKTALSAIRGRTLLAIVTTFGVGTAFETTGLAHWIASGLSSIFGQLGSLGVLLSVSLVTSIGRCEQQRCRHPHVSHLRNPCCPDGGRPSSTAPCRPACRSFVKLNAHVLSDKSNDTPEPQIC